MKKIVFVAFILISAVSFLKAQKSDGCSAATIEDTIVTFAEEMPQFQYGEEARVKFINDNICYPESACENSIEGKVVVQFIINKQGKISNVEALTHKGWGLEEEAIRIVKQMPDWIPGKQNGKPVNVRYTMPVVFRLSQPQLNNQVVHRADENPQYKGGHKEMEKFVRENFKYPEQTIKGVVMLIVLIDSTGIINDVCIRKSFYKEFDEEAIRVVWMMPPWIPGKEKGKPVERKTLIFIQNDLTTN